MGCWRGSVDHTLPAKTMRKVHHDNLFLAKQGQGTADFFDSFRLSLAATLF